MTYVSYHVQFRPAHAQSAPDMSNLETLFTNARTYSDILRKSSLPEVGNWKEEDLDRAVHWANFFKKVLTQLHYVMVHDHVM